ncbi:hypothetical protein A2W32_00320 [candidate division WWE3 bacterium RBG_16_37_10]|uniref:Glycosyltransferase 2-like domain-containing protein n=1 Tax=candidate division WWE3 bacterium RBG_16_37_10 TaxID=1802610 RepID=A0A1F4V1C4_UNCKA|nr:MAG: hypothetical protein A2W32_00320 [candidate division WWE3 bacterium RBG_16_37_10]
MNREKVKAPHQIISANISVSQIYILFCVFTIVFYFTWWLDFGNAGSPLLFGLLFIGEVYHLWQALGYLYTIWDQRKLKPKVLKEFYPVDVFITVCGEPRDVVERTLKAALAMDYPNFKVYILNDSKSRNISNWKEINELAKEYGATSITRDVNKGAKAGNINNGLTQSSAPYFAVFDADHVPHKDFLKKTMPYFEDNKMAIVQTPQYYQNRDDSFLTQAAWEQQELFFGPICRGKNRLNATFWCGTNAVIRREALLDVGGVPEDNIAEDFLASLYMHEKGWNSVYVSEVLTDGMAPFNLGDYVKQQFRWARGSSEVIFHHNPLFKKGLSFGQKMQYLYSSSYYLNGFVVLIDALIPIIVLFTKVLPVKSTTSEFMIYFFPFMFSTIHLLMLSTQNTITFRAIQLSISSFYIFIKACLSSLLRIPARFEVTPKAKETGNFLSFASLHFIYVAVGFIAIAYGLVTQGFAPSVITNGSWILFNIAFFFGFIRAAYPWKQSFENALEKLKTLLGLYKEFNVVERYDYSPVLQYTETSSGGGGESIDRGNLLISKSFGSEENAKLKND